MIYIITNGEHYKIGYSNNPSKRCRQLQTGSSAKLVLYGVTDGTIADEEALHKKFQLQRVRGEWFNLSMEDIEYILSFEAPTPYQPFKNILRFLRS